MDRQRLPKKMRVPAFRGNGVIEFIDKPVPEPGTGQLLVRVRANTLCGSERGQFYSGSETTPGHEAAGIVAAAGPGTSTPVGTPGVIYLMDFCGECRSCLQGFTNQCLNKRGDMGFNQDGGYGEYELVSETIFFPVGDDLPMDEATMLLDIIGTGGHALRRGELVHQDIPSLAIAGAGPIGLGVLAMAKICIDPDLPVFILDTIPYRLELGERLGGIPIQLNSATLADALGAHGLKGIDLAVDTSGRSTARRDCLSALNKRGVLVCVGHGEGLNLQVSPDLIAPERAVLGSEYFLYRDLPGNLEILLEHRSYLSQIITHRLPVTDIQLAFEIFFTGETGKVVILQ